MSNECEAQKHMKTYYENCHSCKPFTGLNSWSWGQNTFSSTHLRQPDSFMLGGEWDRCNGVVHKSDQVAVAAASLVGAKWCYSGESLAV